MGTLRSTAATGHGLLKNGVRKDTTEQSNVKVDQPKEQQYNNHDQNIQESLEGITIPRRTSRAPIGPAQELEPQSKNLDGMVTKRVSGYGANDDDERLALWDILMSYGSVMNDSWIVMEETEIRPFVQCAMDCGLQDLRFTGKHHEGQRVFLKIDRVIINQEWLSAFLESEAHFLPENTSDHSPAVVKFFNMNLGPNPFKYFNMWSNADTFIKTVLKKVNEALKLLNKQQYTDIETHAGNLTKIR
ncbi:hypothetical protein Cgig2_018604 [Carnegiea gigantea]|uniref:Endonuclease/exonuclease/phosphatase domain-containing protein n=1 Tax=Carnegiea gigantea TaxID=171969 RepID=A0A9Q1QH61_9CARY|nr:hypothetical protein Cgig2_018604 [Carnegiea gigantea]